MTDRHVLMLGGHLTFVEDWARSASQVARVTLVRTDERAPNAIGKDANATPIDRVTRYRCRPIRLRPTRVFAPATQAAMVHRLSRLVDIIEASEGAVTHIHTHFYSSTTVPLRLAQRRKLPLIHTEHSSSIGSGHVSRPGLRALRQVGKQAHQLLAVSADLADDMHSIGIDRPIVVAHNPLSPDLNTDPIPQQIDPHETLKLISVGWLNERKDHDTLLRAYRILLDRRPNSHLSIVGSGPLRDRLRALAKHLQVSDSVSFLGATPRTEVLRLLQGSDIYVHTSKHETFGVTLAEAWASGIPVVTLDCGGVSRSVEDIAGRLVTDRDPEALASAISDVADQLPADRAAIRREALTRFSQDSLAHLLDRVYG